MDSSVPEPPAPPPLARLVFHVLADRTAIFAVTPSGAVHGHAAPFGREEIMRRVAQLRDALAVDTNLRGVRLVRHVRPAVAPAPRDHEPLLRALYDDLVAPVAAALPAAATPVVLEPHAALWLLPFAALLDPAGAWLADRWPLLYAPSTRSLDEIRQEPDYGKPAELKALVVGNPAMPQVPPHDDLEITLAPLPGAEDEAVAIAALFDASRRTLLRGAAADRATVESLLECHGIVHLATHGIAYAEDPLASFVALAAPPDGDGRLTARRIVSRSLPADLVVLSACQTGLGRVAGEGMIGLCRAFLVAGARAVVVSQWSVSDTATADLMAAFYRAYIGMGDKAVALQQAMRELRARPEYAPPRYWAPFVVVGAES